MKENAGSKLSLKRSGLCVALALGLSACVGVDVPSTKPFNQRLPGAYAARQPSTGVFVATEWWDELGDRKLAANVMRAVGANPSVWEQQAVAAQARARAVIAGAGRLPRLSAGIEADRSRRNGGTGPGFGRTDTTNLALSASWELDLWGRIAAQSRAAFERYLASNEGLRATRQSIAGLTAKAYVQVIDARQQVALSQRTARAFSETARQVSNRTDAGIGSPGDKFLAIANSDSANAGLAANREALSRAVRQLERLLGEYPDGTVDTATRLFRVPPLPATGMPADLLSRRPDILVAERRLRATGFDVIAARRALLPGINLSGSTGLASPALRSILDGDFTFWRLAGGLTQPIFQAGELAATVNLRNAEQREAANAYVGTVLDALTEVETALAVRGDINQRRRSLCAGARAAQSAERVSLNRYQQGIEPFLTVLESQQRALTASSDCLSAGRAAADNHIDLMIALGGGFRDAPAPLPTSGAMARQGLGIFGEEIQGIFGGLQ